jgi:hypothetical protein
VLCASFINANLDVRHDMHTDEVTRSRLKLEVIGDPEEIRRRVANCFEQYEKAKPLLARWNELTPLHQRKYDKLPSYYAPLILRQLPASRQAVPHVGRHEAGRPGERRATTRRSSSSRGDPSPDGSDPPLARVRGFAVASVRLVHHLARRNAAMRLA